MAVHRRRGPGEDELEEEHHHRREQQRARDGVQHDAVDGVGDAVPPRPLVEHAVEHGVGEIIASRYSPL